MATCERTLELKIYGSIGEEKEDKEGSKGNFKEMHLDSLC